MEIKNIIELYNKFKSNKLETNDQLILNYPETQLNTDLQKNINTIDMLDLNKHVDGIDTDSISYKYCNSLNQLKIDFSVEIKIQNDIAGKTRMMSLNDMLKMMQAYGLQNSKSFHNDLDDKEFKVQNILGEQETVQFIKT